MAVPEDLECTVEPVVRWTQSSREMEVLRADVSEKRTAEKDRAEGEREDTADE